MALAFDATAGGNAAASSLTYAHTCTGSNLILVVGVTINGGTGDNITSVTYNGVNLTKAKVVNTGGQYAYLWYLINPATGTHNVIVTDSETPSAIRAQSASYTGALQSGQPDATGSNTAAPGTSVTSAVVVVNSNCWMVSVVGNDGANAETPAGVLTTARGNQNTVCYIGDSNGVVNTGSQNATWTSASQTLASCAMSIIPSGLVNPIKPYAFFM